MGRRDPVMLAWAAGLLLAVLAYAVGPQYFLFRLIDWVHVIGWRLNEAIADLSFVARDAVRALAIGLYATFVVLSLMVLRRGGRAKGALFVISILFLLAIGQAEFATESNARWAAALALSGFGAVTMTARLRRTAMVPHVY